MPSDFYTLTKRAFTESLELVGIPITFDGLNQSPMTEGLSLTWGDSVSSVTRSCINTPIDHMLFSTPAGFITDISMQVEMDDDDLADFTGLEILSLVTVDGAIMQVRDIKTDPISPIVQLALKKDK